MPTVIGREKLISRASRAETPHTMFATLATELRRAVPYDAAVWRATDPETGMITSPILAENIEDHSCAVYWQYELFTEKINLFRDLAQAPVPVASLWESTGGEPSRSSLYRGFLAPRGVHDELRAVLRVDGRPHGYVSLFRAEGGAAFSTGERRFIEGLVKPMARKLRSYAKQRPEPIADGLIGTGLLLFDAGGALISANDDARRYLEEMPEGPTSVTALGIRIPLWVHGTAMRARAIAEEHERDTARIRMRSRTGRWLVCHASCLREADGRLGVSAVIIERAPISEVTPLIVQAYELSERELEVTQWVARGLSTGRISEELHLSPHTVRDHIKAIFEKLGVSSRGELVGKLFTEYHEPLAPGSTGRR
ncbi:helix-turn-helix transcriptional regulator [Streptomyces lunaelactis]|uniref:LuxR family transcriptional regulator BagY/FevT n=1 Tax=Streptomyces lunaelactis TaxID=1535768 RepID=UPI00158558BD|nr:LuxR family transcriptional regulator BagY/FevT [Streptomyces lunaelactis]NUK59630.1 helix-turn-helix transcriptional regulator [Streptomyces lunaelactis]NUK72002.1 helix-turn-helix transcriptional regulator [Streptomyces lunaelactis]NUK81013.1 helix-turn-helix transcriptional regulator [Streptomyces lunaelactis]